MSIVISGQAKRLMLFCIDGFALFVLLVLAQLLLDNVQSIWFAITWVLGALSGLYLVGRYGKMGKGGVSDTFGVSIGMLFTTILSYPFLSGTDTQRVILLITLAVISIVTLSVIILFESKTQILQKNNERKLLFVLKDNSNSRFETLKEELEANGHVIKRELLDDLVTLDENVNLSDWDAIIYDRSFSKNMQFSSILLKEKIKGKMVVDFVTFYARISGRIPLELINESVLLNSGQTFVENAFLQRTSRLFDLLVGISLAGLFFVPVVFIWLIIKIESKGPAIFKQERLGKNMKPFTLFKFRSMSLDAEIDGPRWATQNDSRVTMFGGILRKTHLDELPQIVNLIRGDIGLVGPRPIRLFFAEKLMKTIPYYHLRFLVKPGLTGWAQVKGPYGANEKEQRIKQELDLYYIMNANIFMYMYLVVGTARIMGIHMNRSI